MTAEFEMYSSQLVSNTDLLVLTHWEDPRLRPLKHPGLHSSLAQHQGSKRNLGQGF